MQSMRIIQIVCSNRLAWQSCFCANHYRHDCSYRLVLLYPLKQGSFGDSDLVVFNEHIPSSVKPLLPCIHVRLSSDV